MVFNSLNFLYFITAVLILYWSFKNERDRNVFLLLSSYFFYIQWEWKYLFLILISSSVDFLCAKKIYSSKHKKLFLSISILVNIGILFVFKYYNFFVESFIKLFGVNDISNIITLNLIYIQYHKYPNYNKY